MAITQHTAPSQRILSLIALEKDDILTVSILTFGIGLLSLASPLAVQTLINIVTMGGVLQPLIVVSFILFALLCLSGSLYILEYYVVERIQRRVFVRSALDVTLSARNMSLQVHDQQNSVELINRFFDVATIQKTTYLLLTNGLAAVMQLLIGSFVLMFYSFFFAAVVIVMFAIAFFIVYVLGHHATKYAIAESYAKYHMVGWLETIAKNIHIFKFARGHELAMQKTDALITQYLTSRSLHFSLLLKQNILAVLVYAIAGTVMLGIGGVLVMNGQLNLGQFVAAEFITFGVLSSFVSFVKKLETYYDMVAAIDKLGVLFDLPQDNNNAHSIALTHPVKIKFDRVNFTYQSNQQVLKNLNFVIENGISTAFIGEYGSGKTTLSEILTGLRNPTDGYVMVNNVDLRQLQLSTLREQIGIANRVEILEDTILENIRLHNTDINVSQVQTILSLLEMDEDIARLPQGLDTLLNVVGSPLSTVQARLLMIARIVVMEPKLLVIDSLLDELDKTSQELAIKLIFDKQKPWTVVIFTRDIAIAKKCEQLIYLDDAMQMNHRVTI